MTMNKLPKQLEELRGLKQWVCWKYVKRKGEDKPSKPPYNPKTGRMARADDATTWVTYDEAVAAAESGKYEGVGIMIPKGYVGIDLDHVLKNGRITTAAAEVMNTLQSYTEYSPSGEGLHIICRGSMPAGRKKTAGFLGNDFEMYDEHSPRYFTVTGNAARDWPIEERTEAAAALHRRFWPQEKPTGEKAAAPADRSREKPSFELYDDLEVIKRDMFNSQNGAEIRALWDGNMTGYLKPNGEPDHSSADLALVNHLYFWSYGDTGITDMLFRQSGLMRPKWDERHGRATYGELTIEKAATLITPRKSPAQLAKEREEAAAAADLGRFKPQNVEQYLLAGGFGKDLDYFRSYRDRKTGFVQIDRYLTLYPGLAVIGGVSSLGKTSFCVQLADQLLDHGETVLYFAMEQQPIELVTKGLTRELYKIDPTTRLTNIDIKNGATSNALEQAKRSYAAHSARFTIINCNFNTTVEQIVAYLEKYIADNSGIKPVVFIDYLQLIAPPADLRSKSQKEITDHVIEALKLLQQEQELLIVCVSNFNRNNYKEPVSEGSFKETGMIEYCSDYLWGLQLSILEWPDYYTKTGPQGGTRPTTDAEKTRMIDREKSKIPKEVEFVSLKNRNGKQFFRAFFQYYTPQDYFREYPESLYNPDLVDSDLEQKVRENGRLNILMGDFRDLTPEEEDDIEVF